jgi:hypothetical protein
MTLVDMGNSLTEQGPESAAGIRMNQLRLPQDFGVRREGVLDLNKHDKYFRRIGNASALRIRTSSAQAGMLAAIWIPASHPLSLNLRTPSAAAPGRPSNSMRSRMVRAAAPPPTCTSPTSEVDRQRPWHPPSPTPTHTFRLQARLRPRPLLYLLSRPLGIPRRPPFMNYRRDASLLVSKQKLNATN